MFIKRYDSSWDNEIYSLFVRSVHESCKGFYTEPELSAWAPEEGDPVLWCRRLRNSKTLLAVDRGVLMGFGSALSGSIEKLFVDPEAQGRGIGRLLLSSLEGREGGEFRVCSSKQSRRFFERQGYRTEQEHHIYYGNTALLTYVMVKPETD